jgi:hypothetical protein
MPKAAKEQRPAPSHCGYIQHRQERICLGVAWALNSKIYAPPNKQKICACLDDPELMARLTSNPLEAQVHMQMLMETEPRLLRTIWQAISHISPGLLDSGLRDGTIDHQTAASSSLLPCRQCLTLKTGSQDTQWPTLCRREAARGS